MFGDYENENAAFLTRRRRVELWPLGKPTAASAALPCGKGVCAPVQMLTRFCHEKGFEYPFSH